MVFADRGGLDGFMDEFSAGFSDQEGKQLLALWLGMKAEEISSYANKVLDYCRCVCVCGWGGGWGGGGLGVGLWIDLRVDSCWCMVINSVSPEIIASI